MTAYMKIKGICGTVTAKGFEAHIQIEACRFGLNRRMNTQLGIVTNRENSRPSVTEVIVEKRVDKVSPLLFKESSVGTSIPIVELKFVSTGEKLSEYHSIILSDTIISGYEFSYESVLSEKNNTVIQFSKPREKISMNFRKIEIKSIPYDKDHKACSPSAAGYDLEIAQAI